MITEDQFKQHLVDIFEYIGEDPNRAGLIDTPDRIARMCKEIFRGYDPKQKPKITTFPNGQDGIVYDSMVIDKGDFYSLCEHHCRTFFGEYWFAYIPNPQGRILGISKIGRVVDYCAARLQIQERLVHDVVEMLTEALGNEYPPLGVAMVMKARHMCYDKETEILTKKGFIPFPQLTEEDLVAQYDKDTDRISFVKPYEIIKERHQGKMIRIKQKCYDLLVTPDHRMLAQTEWKHYHTSEPYQFMTAAEIYGRRMALKKAAIYEGEGCLDSYVFGKKSFTPIEFAQLMGLYLSEGWSGPSLRSGVITITQDKKSWAYEEIKSILSNLGFSEIVQQQSIGKTKVQFRLYNKELVDYLQQFGRSADKYVPQEIKEMPVEERKAFLHCYFLGDGFKHKEDGYYQITTISERMGNDLQEMFALIGVDCTQFHRKESGIDIILHKRTNSDKWKDCVRTKPDSFSEETYDDYVYCANVDKGALVVRRNGHIAISGNCKESRGARKKGIMTSSYLTGCFMNDPALRAEFMRMVEGGM